MNSLLRLGNQIIIRLPTDKDGYLGRECPNRACKGYFKIAPGSGTKQVTELCCPYCAHVAHPTKFITQDQLKYAKSVAIRRLDDALLNVLKGLETETKPTRGFGIGVSIEVKPGPRPPIYCFREKALETHVECSNCARRYAVFGVFAFCPDCRQHNSFQILSKNLEIVVKMLDLACSGNFQSELSEHLVGNALEDCVSAFDGFARELCRVNAQAASDADKTLRLSFQNLPRAREEVKALFNVDIAEAVTDDEWKIVNTAFQKRHLLAHKMGVVDSDYVKKSCDTRAIAGRKIRLNAEEVRQVVLILKKLGEYFVHELRRLGSGR